MKRSSILIFIVLLCFSSRAQEQDFQLWNSISLKNKINKDNSFYIKLGIRYRENATINYKDFIDLRFKHNLKKYINLSLGYRNIIEYDISSSLEKKNRFYIDLNLSKKKKRYYFDIRNRILTQGNINGFNSLFRQRIKISYNIRKIKLEPSVSFEYFYGFSNKVNKIRTAVSMSYPIIKKLDLDFIYKIQNEFYIADPLTLFIFETKLNYKL